MFWIRLQQQLGAAPECFSQRQLVLAGELFDLRKKTVGNLDLRFCHTPKSTPPSI